MQPAAGSSMLQENQAPESVRRGMGRGLSVRVPRETGLGVTASPLGWDLDAAAWNIIPQSNVAYSIPSNFKPCLPNGYILHK